MPLMVRVGPVRRRQGYRRRRSIANSAQNVTISVWPISVHALTVGGMKRTLRHRFGKRIRELRQATGLSQEAFADHVGFARTYMSRIETGAANPSLDAIETLATALQISVAELFSTL